MSSSVPLSIRFCTSHDIQSLYTLTETGLHITEPDYFETALQEQTDKKRLIFLAFWNDILAGYAHLNFFPHYTPFLRLRIPEIQDLFVHPDFRCRSIGAGLIMACEESGRTRNCTDIGIGVGVGAKFGSAQRLYARTGFLPDGAGVVFDRIPVSAADVRPIDDRLCMMMIKQL